MSYVLPDWMNPNTEEGRNFKWRDIFSPRKKPIPDKPKNLNCRCVTSKEWVSPKSNDPIKTILEYADKFGKLAVQFPEEGYAAQPHRIVFPKSGDVYQHVGNLMRFVVTLQAGNYFYLISGNGETDIMSFGRWEKEAGQYKPISRNQRVIVSVEND